MKYEERVQDLFSVSDEYYFVQCIAADCRMDKGIAVEFNKRFDTKNKLLDYCKGDLLLSWLNRNALNRPLGFCVCIDKVFNLVTKLRSFGKPTYETLKGALLDLKRLVVESEIKHLAMPLIGCGLDRLEWDKVSKMIQEVFEDTDVEILVCRQ